MLKGCKTSSVPMHVKLFTSFHCKLECDTDFGSGIYCCSKYGVCPSEETLDHEIELSMRKSSPKGFAGITDNARRCCSVISLFSLALSPLVCADTESQKAFHSSSFGFTRYASTTYFTSNVHQSVALEYLRVAKLPLRRQRTHFLVGLPQFLQMILNVSTKHVIRVCMAHPVAIVSSYTERFRW